MNYIDYINRNKSVIDQISSEETKVAMLHHIRWALELASRLDKLDYDKRDEAINNIIRVMNDDFKAAGFEIEEDLEKTQEIPTL